MSNETLKGMPVAFLQPMETAPRDGTPIGVVHKKVNGNSNWVGTVRLGNNAIEPEDKTYDLVVNYNGDNLVTGFRGVYIGWFQLPKISE